MEPFKIGTFTVTKTRGENEMPRLNIYLTPTIYKGREWQSPKYDYSDPNSFSLKEPGKYVEVNKTGWRYGLQAEGPIPPLSYVVWTKRVFKSLSGCKNSIRNTFAIDGVEVNYIKVGVRDEE